MIRKIPLKAIPNQRFNVVLNDQNCTIHLFQRGDYLYMDFTVDGKIIRTGAICLSATSILAYPTPYFNGYLFFTDVKRKNKEPNYAELGSRFLLCYTDGA